MGRSLIMVFAVIMGLAAYSIALPIISFFVEFGQNATGCDALCDTILGAVPWAGALGLLIACFSGGIFVADRLEQGQGGY